MNLHGLKVKISKLPKGEHCYQAGDSIILSQEAYNILVELMSDTAFKTQFQSQPAPPPKPQPKLSSADILALMTMTPKTAAEVLAEIKAAKSYHAKMMKNKFDIGSPARMTEETDLRLRIALLEAVVSAVLISDGRVDVSDGKFIVSAQLLEELRGQLHLKVYHTHCDDNYHITLE